MKVKALVWRLAPLIVVFSCRDDITAPPNRSLTVSSPRMDAVFTGVRPAISAGGYHTCVLKNDGTLTCFGYNPSGQSTPPADIGISSQVSLGTFHSCVVRTDATPFCWGFNGEGQRAIPSGVTSVAQISAAFHHTCALNRDGSVVCWGLADLQTQVPAGIIATQISAGTLHTCALTRVNSVVCWGYNTDGELTVPGDLGPVSQVSVGEGFSCALKADGTVACWGNNRYNQLRIPTGLASVTQISAGYFHVCALKADHTVVCWGNGEEGQTNVPASVTSVSQVAGGQFHTCAINTDGTVACWGDNSRGQATVPAGLNVNHTQPQAITFTSAAPVPATVGGTYIVTATGGPSGNPVTFSVPTTGAVCSVSGRSVTFLATGTCTIAADQAASADYFAAPEVTQSFQVMGKEAVAAGGYHTCALKIDGGLVCWGYNPSGQSTPPTDIGTVAQVSLGTFHSCVVRTDATPFCWGFNGEGQRAIPANVTSVSQISAAFHHTCALRSDGTVACWGIADLQTQVPTGLTAIQISAGTLHSCALQRDNTITCWGYNTDGELNVPPGLGPVSQVSVGEGFSCALKADGTVACWGNNRYGQSTVPTGLASVTQISAGYFHVCALISDGTLRCWGNAEEGQTTVPAAERSVTQVSAGQFHTCAVNSDGSVACWGENSRGQSTVPAGLNLTHVLASQTVQFTSVAPNPGAVGTTYGLSAQGTASGNAVTFSSLSTTVCTVSGTTTSLVGAGTCTVAVDQAAGNGYDAAAQQTQTFTVVAPQPQSINFTSIPPNPALVGGSYAVTATGGGSGNPVVFNSLTTSVCLVLGNTVSFLKIGTCRISADQNGADFYLPAVQQQQAFDIGDVQTITITSSPPSPAVIGGTYAITATGGLSGNLVTFSSLTTGVCTVSGSSVRLIGAGDCTVAADQAAGAGYLAAARKTQTFNVVQPIAQVVSFTSAAPTTPIVGGTYAVTLTGGASGNPIVLRSTTSTVCSVIGTTVTFIRIGTCHLTADQDGTPPLYLAAAQQEQTFDIYDVQSITFNSTPPDPGIAGQTYSVAAFGGLSGNPVTFSSLSPTVCTISGTTANLIAAGTCNIAADQAAGAGYLAAHRATQSFTVIQQQPQLITFTSRPPNPAIVGTTYTVSATGGGSPNPVLFGSLTPDICMLLGNTVTFARIGTCTITADQRGNTFFLPADRQQQQIDIYGLQAISFTSTPPSPGIVGGTYSVTATGGLSGNLVTFSSLTTAVCTVHGVNTVSFVGAGNCIVAADQAAGSGYLAAPRQTQNVPVIQPIAQTISFTSTAPSQAVVGGTYTVSATGGASGNQVVFTSLATDVCTVSGSTVTFRARGSCHVAADQAGNTNYFPAAQQQQIFDVFDVQQISFTSTAPSPIFVGETYTVTATGGLSGNPVTFSSLRTDVCTVTGSAVTLIRAGTCAVAADQAGGNGYLAAVRVSQSFTVTDPASQTINFTSIAPNPGVTGSTYSLSATGGASGNPVTFSSLSTTVCTVSGSTATLIRAGTCTVAADQAGRRGYLPAPEATQAFTVVAPIPQSISFTSTTPSPAIVGGSYGVAATGGASGNPVLFSSLTPSVCFVIGNTVSLSARGTCRVAADQTGNALYLNAAQQVQVFDIYDTQSITFSSTASNPIFVGETYSVSATGGLSGNPVTFSSLSTDICTVSGSTATLISGGTCIVAADQAGGNGYLAATRVSQSFTVAALASQTINFTSTPPNPGVTGTTYSLSATGGASGNPVTFSSLSTTVCTVSGSTATLIRAGTCTVAADQAARRGYLAAAQATQRFAVVEPIPQSISFTSAPSNPAIVGTRYDVSASGGASGIPVQFNSLTPNVCFLIGNTVTLATIGTCRISADQAGNTFYLPAPQQQQAFDIYDVQAITFASTAPNPGVVGTTYTVSATGGLSGNLVTFSSLSGSVCTISGATASFVGAGTCVIAADQAAGGGYLAAPRKTQSFNVVAPIAQTILFTSTPPNPPIVGGAYTAAASGGGSGNPVTFSSLTPGTCGVSGAMVSFTSRGTCTIAANQAGSVTYLPAPQVTQNFVIDTRPVANAGSPQTGNEGSAVTFNGSGSSDADGDALTYRWDFGDGTTQNTSSATVQHVYNDNGTYVVTLLVSDAPGATSAPATTSAVIANVAPTATFAPATSVPEGPMTLSLTSPRDAAGDQSTLQYAFDCGDGLGYQPFSTSASFACTANSGNRTVRAKVQDKDGGVSEYSAPVSVTNVAPSITIVSAPTNATMNTNYTIQFRFSDPGNDAPWSYQISWGNGVKTALTSTSTQGQVISKTYIYGTPATYTISITVTDKDGATSTVTRAVTIVRPAPSPGI